MICCWLVLNLVYVCLGEDDSTSIGLDIICGGIGDILGYSKVFCVSMGRAIGGEVVDIRYCWYCIGLGDEVCMGTVLVISGDIVDNTL